MNTAVIRFIDRRVGSVLCYFLTLYKRGADLFCRPNARACSRIIFIKLIEQGSTVLAYPALKKGVRLAGKQNVYFLVFKKNRPILELLDVLSPENIIEIDGAGLAPFFLTSLRAIWKIRRLKIDCCVDMEFFSRATALLAYLSGAKTRVGLHRFHEEGPYRGDLFTHKLSYNPYLHTRRFFLTLVEAVSHEASPNAPMTFQAPSDEGVEMPRFRASAEEQEDLKNKLEILTKNNLGRPVFVLNPSISDLLPIRKWPEEYFARLGRMLLREYPGSMILITGTVKEREAAAQLAVRIGRAFSLAGETSLRELLTLYSMADCLVTSDSGPALFASLTPIRAVVIFGPETPLLYGLQAENRRAVSPSFVCSPCVNVYNQRESACRTGLCLRHITPEQVLKEVKGLLS